MILATLSPFCAAVLHKELIDMDTCRYCGSKLDHCNESEIVCPWCGEADCWPTLDDLIGFDFDDFDGDFDLDTDDETNADDTS
jgi:hypothetical protein